VIFDIVYDDSIAYARLQNSGASPALEVRVSIEPRLHWDDKEDGIGFIEKGVSFMAPKRELSQPFGWTGKFFKQYPELKFRGSISYKDSEEQDYTDSFSIDLSYLKGMTYIGKVNIGREIEGIKKALERFQSSSFSPLVRTIDEFAYREERLAQLSEGSRQLQELETEEKGPNKAPEPTPGAVTPRAPSGDSK